LVAAFTNRLRKVSGPIFKGVNALAMLESRKVISRICRFWWH